MTAIKQIQEMIRKSAEESRKQYAENGNTALQPKVNEPIIPLPNNTPNPVINTAPAATSPTIQVTPKQELKSWIRTHLKEGRDFGKLPSVPRPVLFREGALRIMHHLNLRPQVTLLDSVVSADGTSAGYTITVKVALINLEGEPVIESIGSASTLLEPSLRKASVNTCTQQAQKRALVAAIRMLITC